LKQIFDEIERPDIFQSISFCDTNEVRKKLISNYNNLWKREIATKPKLRFYRIFKDTFAEEMYLTCSLNRIQRSYIAQLRLGILQLAIETGRYRSIPLENRICQLCDLNCIENEVHFLFICPIYATKRKTFFDNINMTMNVIEHIDQAETVLHLLLHMFNNCRYAKITARYIVECMDLRKTFMYK
jgi:hypothetical protein